MKASVINLKIRGCSFCFFLLDGYIVATLKSALASSLLRRLGFASPLLVLLSYRVSDCQLLNWELSESYSLMIAQDLTLHDRLSMYSFCIQLLCIMGLVKFNFVKFDQIFTKKYKYLQYNINTILKYIFILCTTDGMQCTKIRKEYFLSRFEFLLLQDKWIFLVLLVGIVDVFVHGANFSKKNCVHIQTEWISLWRHPLAGQSASRSRNRISSTPQGNDSETIPTFL